MRRSNALWHRHFLFWEELSKAVDSPKQFGEGTALEIEGKERARVSDFEGTQFVGCISLPPSLHCHVTLA